MIPGVFKVETVIAASTLKVKTPTVIQYKNTIHVHCVNYMYIYIPVIIIATFL